MIDVSTPEFLSDAELHGAFGFVRPIAPRWPVSWLATISDSVSMALQPPDRSRNRKTHLPPSR